MRAGRGSRGSSGWQHAPDDRAFLAQRARHHLVYRAAVRATQLAVSRQGGASGSRWAAVLGWTVGDVAEALALRRYAGFGLLPRLVADTFDIGYWAASGDDCELAAVAGVPLSVEAGIRMGAVALVVPLVSGLATTALRRYRKLPLSVLSFRWQVLGVAAGTGMAAYRRSNHRVVLARHEWELRARLQQSYVAGQHDVAMGVDSVVDLLSRTSPLLGDGSDDRAVGRLLAAWKQSLAADGTAGAVYLGVALAQWQRRHNAANHALESDVYLVLEAGAGTVLLTPAQGRRLEAALDRLPLRGRVPVALVDADEAARPATPRRLTVGDHRVVVTADRTRGLQALDVGPACFIAGAMWCLDTVSAANSRSAPWAVGPLAVSALGLAAWAHRQVYRLGDDGHWRVVVAAVGWSLANSVAGTATMTRTRAPNGIQRYPFLTGVNTLCLMLPLYARDFTPGHRVAVIAGMAATVGAGLLLLPEPVVWTHLGCELLWCVAQALSTTGLGDGLTEDAALLSARLADAEKTAIGQAFADGRGDVVSMVADAGRTVRHAFDLTRDQLGVPVAREVERRLAEIDARLGQLAGHS